MLPIGKADPSKLPWSWLVARARYEHKSQFGPELTAEGRSRTRKETGFSLVELLVVLLLIGLGSLLVLPSMDRALREREVRQSALELAASARYLRSRAISEGMFQRLVFNTAENSYEAVQVKKVFLPSEVEITGIEGGEPLGQGFRQFFFFPNGSVLGGEIGISHREGSFGYSVRFEPLTGRVLVLRESGQ